MNGNIHGLSWFPNFPDKFVTWGQEINLYDVRQNKSDDSAVKGISGRLCNLSAAFLAIESRYQYARCVAPSYHKERPIIAVGLSDGKIGICTFYDVVDSNWEYTPRQQRMCVCLAWNELDPNILAIGHDRHRSDSCITIWDIERGLPKETANFFGHSESANSLCWDNNHRVLIAGMSQKQIKLFDLRQSNNACQSIQTKSINGLAISPQGNYLCSFVDSVVMLWDLRVMDRPLKQIQAAKNHLLLSWCTTKSSLLSTLNRESPYVTLYDINCLDVEKGREVYHTKKQIMPFPNKNNASNKIHSLTSLSWHPLDFERALLLSETGNILDFKLPLPMWTTNSNHYKLPILLQNPISTPNSYNFNSNIPNNSDTKVIESNEKMFPLNCTILEPDLLEINEVEEMRLRALGDYGIKVDLKRNDELNLSEYLKNVWQTLNNMCREGHLTGLKSILDIGMVHTSEAFMASTRVEKHTIRWPEYLNNSNNLTLYRSEKRDVALSLCGWPREKELEQFTSTLCENKEFSRAAMICVFEIRILHACDILSEGADVTSDPSTFRITAIALSSFNADRCKWRNQRSNVKTQIQNPHLRAIFSFLMSENENFDSVLNEEAISLSDRLAFACKYLSESKIAEYVKQQIQQSIENGDLNGLLLTGESLDGINILQAYLDRTFDVQTVALIAINYFHREHFNDNRIQYWISSYLNYLNSWGFWEKRSELEIKIEGLRSSPRTARSVFLSCNFCGKSVSNALQEHSEARLRNTSSNVNKLSSCPSCRKPLPRCSLCLLHMGTTLNTTTVTEPGHQTLGWQSKPFAKWFSWCQTCRHGGHTEHIMQWFKQNSECPVSSCSCKCFDLDANKPQINRDNM